MRMRHLNAGLLLVLVTCLCATAEELRVAKTVPALGATEVDPELSEILLVFSAPVKKGSWSLAETGQGVFPFLTGEPRFVSEKLCVLIVRLGPATTYSFSINSAAEKGFKSATDDSVAVTPYVLTFTTRAAAANATPSAAPPFPDAAGSAPAASSTVAQASTTEAKPLDEAQTGPEGEAAPVPAADTARGASDNPAPSPPEGVGAPSEAAPPAGSDDNAKPGMLAFRRSAENIENAFSILVPLSWETRGGMLRPSPAGNDPMRAPAPTLDYAVLSDTQSAIMIRALPRRYYYDWARSPAAQRGIPLQGNQYEGMMARPLMNAYQFLAEEAFPSAHPYAADLEVLSGEPMPELAEAQHYTRKILPLAEYDAMSITLAYDEGGRRYKEKIMALIEFAGPDTGFWSNRETWLIRAPAEVYEVWEPILVMILKSIRWDPQWIGREIERQIMQDQAVAPTWEEMEWMTYDAHQQQQRTYDILCERWCSTAQNEEPYLDPFTNERQTGTTLWAHRWVGADSVVLYTDNPDYDPNLEPNFPQEFRRAPGRP